MQIRLPLKTKNLHKVFTGGSTYYSRTYLSPKKLSCTLILLYSRVFMFNAIEKSFYMKIYFPIKTVNSKTSNDFLLHSNYRRH